MRQHPDWLGALDENIKRAERDVAAAEEKLRQARHSRQKFFDDNLRCTATKEIEVSAGRRSYFETLRCENEKHNSDVRHRNGSDMWRD